MSTPPFTVLAELPGTQEYLIGDSAGQVFVCTRETKEHMAATFRGSWPLPILSDLLNCCIPLLPKDSPSGLTIHYEVVNIKPMAFPELNVVLHCGFGKVSKTWVVSGPLGLTPPDIRA